MFDLNIHLTVFRTYLLSSNSSAHAQMLQELFIPWRQVCII